MRKGTMTPSRRRPRAFAGMVLLALGTCGLAACGDDDPENTAESVQETASSLAEDAQSTIEEAGTDAAEAAARNIATEQGEEQFKESGYELDGKLSCDASAASGAKAVNITCSGKTKDGAAAALEGATNEVPGASVTELEGNFVGTVGGQQVFQTSKLGG